MKSKQKILTLLLAMVMVLSCIQTPLMAVSATPADNESIQSTFTDAVFLQAVRNLIGKTNGEDIYQSDVRNITKLDISDLYITDLVGIEYFTALKELYCYGNDLLTLDLSHNPNLEVLDCSYNLEMDSINLSNCFKLKSLDCNYTALQNLDISKNADLTRLVCYSTNLSALDISNNLLLETLDVYDAHLVTLDITNNTRLTSLDCSSNDMCAVDSVVGVENCTLLQEDDAFVFEPQNTVRAGHSWDGSKITEPPTCSLKGELTYTCTHCGITKTEDIPAKGQNAPDADHSWNRGKVTMKPNCTQPGEITYTCTGCGKNKTEELAATGQDAPDVDHSWDNGTVTLKPTCIAEGKKTYTCTNCGKTKLESIAAVGHVTVIDKEKFPTCTENGLTVGSHCSECSTILVSQKIVPATGHTSTWEKNNAKHWERCTACGWESAKENHTYTDDKDTTCNICDYKHTDVSPTPSTPPPTSGGSYYSYYTITAAASDGGKITPNGKVIVCENSDKTFTVIPGKGYVVSDVLVDGKSVGIVKEYTFKDVSKNHTIEVCFRVVDIPCPRDKSCPLWNYIDASTTAWYHDGVHYCIENGLMTGYGSGKFAPNDTLTRGMLAQILYNKAGHPTVAGNSPFDDVSSGKWYTNAISWAAEKDIVNGYGDRKFGPDDSITREQIVAMLWRYAGSPVVNGTLDGFTDGNKTSKYAQDSLCWAVEKGIVSGKGGGILDPTGKATRAEAAAMLQRYMTMG